MQISQPTNQWGGHDRGVTSEPTTLPLPPSGEPPTIVWLFADARAVLSSAAVGGGWTDANWLLNVGVASNYGRTDLEAHAAEVASSTGLVGVGVTLFTAADTRLLQSCVSERGIRVDATVGVSRPTWAADTSADVEHPPVPGTINLVIQSPIALSHAAAVNAIVTITEAKSQALFERGIAGTGTASDAVALVWPHQATAEDAVSFAGPRSPWGLELAQAVHSAVLAGLPPSR